MKGFKSLQVFLLFLIVSTYLTALSVRAGASDLPATQGEEVLSEAQTTAKKEKNRKKGLVRENGHYRYYKGGERLREKWKRVNGKKYYFKKNGNAATGSYKVKGQYYIVPAD